MSDDKTGETAQEALDHIVSGVKRFREEVYPQQRELFEKLAYEQKPRAMFITCADSRIIPELITQSSPGDLFVTCRVAAHPVFSMDGRNLRVTVPITFPEAALGADVEVPTVDGTPVKVRIPAGTRAGRTFRVKGRGVATTKGTGDLLVTVEVAVPAKLSDTEREAIEALAAATTESPRQHLFSS